MKRCLIVASLVAACGSPPTCERLASELAPFGLRIDVRSAGEADCAFEATGSTVGVQATGDPAPRLRRWFEASGWEEVLSRSADGPGVTTFVYAHDGESCEVRGGAPSYLEGGEIIVAESYDLTVRCVSEADPGAQVPDRPDSTR